MKIKSLHVIIVTVLSLFLFSCSKDESSTQNSSSTTTTNTWVKLTAQTFGGVKKSNYIVMMFDQPVSQTGALPPILMQVTTDANGLAYFDLNSMVTSTTPKTYYFEAFVPDGPNYILKSVTHPSFSIAKGRTFTSAIIVE
jgi:hypothetical protein